MQQAKFSLSPPLIEFVSDYQRHGFKDKSSMVRAALMRLKEEINRQSLEQSADLYAEVYSEDADLRDLTDVAVVGWPDK